ncbi:hypothetical protein BCR44DRAFT_294537 [Catenaria anguillulae PL171]|uniref:Uncharacterized protein n=1 Tax=Catenaria anguillulae PL171 TaxID=765915 RepID=A0A1Y2I0Z8_9FUNG|nr:hypothetical protein BCR44DRAFT_294537 [Catenaria anguillulae PL171]
MIDEKQDGTPVDGVDDQQIQLSEITMIPLAPPPPPVGYYGLFPRTTSQGDFIIPASQSKQQSEPRSSPSAPVTLTLRQSGLPIPPPLPPPIGPHAWRRKYSPTTFSAVASSTGHCPTAANTPPATSTWTATVRSTSALLSPPPPPPQRQSAQAHPWRLNTPIAVFDHPQHSSQ